MQQLNASVRDYTASLTKATSELSRQNGISKQLNDNLKNGLNAAPGPGITDATDAIRQASDEAQNAQNNMNGMTGAIDDASKQTKNFGRTTKGVFKEVKKDGISVTSVFKGIGSAVMSIGGFALNVGRSLFNVFSKAQEFLMEKSLEMMQAGQQITQAWEKVRGEFGNFESTAGNIKQAFGALNDSGSALNQTGLSMSSVFGYGADGVAAKIEFLGEMARGAGERFILLADQFKDYADEAAVLNKAIGLSGEAIANLGMSAKANGETVEGALQEITRMGAYMEKTMGVSAKAVGKAFNEMATDIETFGGMSRKEMMATAAFATKLGVSVKALQGIVGKTDDFESAAKAAADMGATFGMQIDAMNLMAADPGEKLQMIKDAFNQTGKSFEQMSRQEKARLADISGMDVTSLSAALDPSNAAVNLEDFQSAAEEAADGAITQEEANLRLAKSIEKMTASLEGLTSSGFLDNFLNGVMKGIMEAPEFREILKGIGESMKIVFQAGREVGRMLASMLGPGGALEGLGKALKSYFDPKAMAAKMDGVKKAFRSFTDMLKTDPKKAVKELLTNLKNTLFGNGIGMNSVVSDGLKKTGVTIIKGLAGLLEYVIEGFTSLIKSFVKFLKGDKKTSKEAGEGVGGMLTEAFKDIGSSLKDAAGALGDALVDLIKVVWEKHGGKIMAVFGTGLGLIFLKYIGSVFPFGAISGAFKGIFGKLSSMFGGATGGGDPKETKSMSEQMGEVGSAVGKGVNGFVDGVKDIGLKDLAKAGLVFIGLATMFSVALVPFALGLSAAINAGGDALSNPLKVVGFMGAVYLAVKAASEVINSASKIGPSDVTKAIPAILAIIAVTAVLGLLGMAISNMISASPEIPLGKTLLFLVALGSVLAMAVGTVVAATVIGLVLSGPQALLALAGLGALLLVVPVLGALGMAISAMIKASPDVPAAKVGVFLAALGGVLAAAAVIVPISLVVGALIIASLGLIIPAFLATIKMIKTIADTIAEVVKTIGSIPEDKAKRAADLMPTIKEIVEVIGKGLAAVIAIGLVTLLDGGKQAIEDGMKLVNDIMSSLSQTLANALFYIDAVVTGDPTVIEKKVSIVAQLVSALAPVTDIVKAGLELAKTDPAQAAIAIGAAARLANSLTTGLAGLVGSLVAMTKELSEEDIKKAGAVGQLLGGVGQMLSGLKIPPEVMNTITGTNKEDGTLTDTETTTLVEKASDKIAAFGQAMSAMLGAVGPAVSSIVEAVKGISIGKDDKEIKAFVTKVDAISKLFSSLGGLGTMMSSMGGGNVSSTGQRGLDRLVEVFTNGKIQNLINAASKVTLPAELATGIKALDEAPKIFDKVSKAVSSGESLGSQMANTVANLEKIKSTAAQMSYDNVVHAIEQFNELQTKIASAPAVDIIANLEKFFNEGLGIKGESIKVNREPVQITINLQVNMKAEDVAKTMVETKLITKGEKYDKLIQDGL